MKKPSHEYRVVVETKASRRRSFNLNRFDSIHLEIFPFFISCMHALYMLFIIFIKAQETKLKSFFFCQLLKQIVQSLGIVPYLPIETIVTYHGTYYMKFHIQLLFGWLDREPRGYVQHFSSIRLD